MSLELDAYHRVSRVGGREGDSFQSPKIAHDDIDKWAAAHKITVLERETDLDQTGGKLDRPGLDRILERIESGATGGIAVASLDRLSRAGVADALNLIERIHEAGGKIAVIDLGIDPTTPMGEFAMTVLLALARMQLRQYKEKWRTSKGNAVARGVHFRAPFGYLKPGRGQPIVIDPSTAQFVVDAFELRRDGRSWADITRYLNEHCTPQLRENRNGEQVSAERWTHGTVGHLIRNRAYLGEARQGEHVKPDAHPAIVTADLWARANDSIPRAPSRNGGDGSLLTGLVRCAGCSHGMTPSVTQSGRRTTALYTYRCRKHHGGGTCEASCSIERTRVEEYVVEAFRDRYRDIDFSGAGDSTDLAEHDAIVTRAEAELAAYRDTEDILADVGGYKDGLTVKARAVQDARSARDAAHAKARGFDYDETGWDGLTLPQRRRSLSLGIDAIMIRKALRPGARVEERVRILWRGEGPDDLPGRGRGAASSVVPFDW